MAAPTFPAMDAVAARKRIMVLAWCVAVEAPKHQNKWVLEARTDWKLIHELRQRFREAGYDVDAAMARLTKAVSGKAA